MTRYVRFLDEGGPRFGVLDGDQVAVIDPHPFGPHELTGVMVPVEGLRLLAPVLPTKIVCIGKNYREHAEELGTEQPAEPLLFLKPTSAVIGPGDPILYPVSQSSEVHHEVELAVVIGRILRDATEQEALAGIFGFTAANDVTARDLQRQDSQWTRAKGFDSFLPLGPAIATDLDFEAVGLRTTVDGVTRQDGNTRDMAHGVGTLLAYISRIMTLLPTDLVLTGTPAGVGPIRPGETVSVTVDGVGTLTNPVVARS